MKKIYIVLLVFMLTSCNIEFDKNSINSEFKINCSTEFVSNDSLGQNKNISLHINNIITMNYYYLPLIW